MPAESTPARASRPASAILQWLGFIADVAGMLALRFPPDFSKLAAMARALPPDRPWVPRLARRELQAAVSFDRRRMPRRQVDAPVYLGVIPPMCEKLRLSRIPVSVFKPLEAGWATDLSTQGLGLLTEKPLSVGVRHWVRLDRVATRPTILPGRVLSCDPIPPEGPDAREAIEAQPGVSSPSPVAFRVRVAFLIQDATIPSRLGFVEDPLFAVA